MREDNMHGGVGPTKMRLFHDCILLAVQWKAGYRFYTNSPEHNLALSNWNAYFWVRCCETHSFDAPVTMAFQSIELARLSSVHYAPESPTSN